MREYRRLPLEKLDNARELGGFPTPGGVTAYGVFLRSEIPSSLTDGDIRFLKEYGLKMVIDFRGKMEIEKTPDVLAAEDWIEYLHMPMFDEAAARGVAKGSLEPLPADFSWGKHYIQMADSRKAWVKEVLEALAGCAAAALFHCTTGKDRTGIVAALLLGMCGVADNDIAADYCVSQVYLQDMYKTMSHLMPVGAGGDMSDPFFSTAPENILMLLRHLNSQYGGISEYVAACGVSGETVDKIREKLIRR